MCRFPRWDSNVDGCCCSVRLPSSNPLAGTSCPFLIDSHSSPGSSPGCSFLMFLVFLRHSSHPHTHTFSLPVALRGSTDLHASVLLVVRSLFLCSVHPAQRSGTPALEHWPRLCIPGAARCCLLHVLCRARLKSQAETRDQARPRGPGPRSLSWGLGLGHGNAHLIKTRDCRPPLSFDVSHPIFFSSSSLTYNTNTPTLTLVFCISNLQLDYCPGHFHSFSTVTRYYPPRSLLLLLPGATNSASACLSSRTTSTSHLSPNPTPSLTPSGLWQLSLIDYFSLKIPSFHSATHTYSHTPFRNCYKSNAIFHPRPVQKPQTKDNNNNNNNNHRKNDEPYPPPPQRPDPGPGPHHQRPPLPGHPRLQPQQHRRGLFFQAALPPAHYSLSHGAPREPQPGPARPVPAVRRRSAQPCPRAELGVVVLVVFAFVELVGDEAVYRQTEREKYLDSIFSLSTLSPSSSPDQSTIPTDKTGETPHGDFSLDDDYKHRPKRVLARTR